MPQGTWKMIIGIVGIAISLIIFPIILTGAEEIVTAPSTDISQVTTGVGVTSGTMTLTNDPWNNSVNNITSVTSSTTSDTNPAASSYNSSTNILTVTGLAASTTRTLTAGYNYSDISSYTGLESVVEIAPLMLFTALFIGGGLMSYSGYRAMRRR